MATKHVHGAAGLGQLGGLVWVIEESMHPQGAVGVVVATDRDVWPAAGYAEVMVPGRGCQWVPDVSLMPVLATR